ncbi:hypothetical protein [Siphonobacter aquaeclarae]|uniref:Uncharacterized protein n=1 Tax=Siphonobacter aquaeclarae TaxID=563176 RepID=A0A1G9Q1A0_9BACT|nr:hypothetical protein [Siphonobacter aquaeclarae]SDM04769.1 hypothetical protein SAMN04488090_2423 [Siphonobacter aquaeclarae]
MIPRILQQPHPEIYRGTLGANATPRQIRMLLQAEYLDSLVEKVVSGYLEYDRAGFSDSEAAERGLQAVCC